MTARVAEGLSTDRAPVVPGFEAGVYFARVDGAPESSARKILLLR